MRVGVSLASFHNLDDVRLGARWMVERAAAAREAGLDSLFVGDHHGMPRPYYQNVPILARMLAEWGDGPAGCLFLFPLWNPVLLAEQLGTLASIHPGRFIVQCALGDDPRQFAAMGANIRTRPSAFEEALDIIRRLFAGEVLSSSGRYHFEGARTSPTPPEPVDFWIGGSAEPSVDRAARLGDGFLAGPELTPRQAAHWAAFYRERCAAHGRRPGLLAIRRDIYVGESPADAQAVADPIVEAGYRGFDPSATIYGSPDEVAAKFRELAGMGYSDVIVRQLVPDQEHALASIRRLKEVRQAVRSA